MPVNSINNISSAKAHKSQSEQKINKTPVFTGSFNPVVTVMDMIDRGGFAASFIAQDGIGMAAPRIYEGLNRNREKDENGKKVGPLNWQFARREGIREILSGPSAFLIPMGIMAGIKKFSGSGNNVHVDHIEALGGHFKDFAINNPNTFSDISEFKKGYYKKVFEDVLKNSTDNTLSSDEIIKKASKYAKDLVDIENLKAGKKKSEAKNVFADLVKDYVNLRKSSIAPSENEFGAILTSGEKDGIKVGTNIKKLMQSLTDYTDDAFEKTSKYLKTNSSEKLGEFLSGFNKSRIGTRVLSNLSMWGAVVAFYAMIPKLYNMGLKEDPGLKGLVKEQPNKTEDKDGSKNKVSFTGNAYQKIGDFATDKGKSILSKFEFNGPAMSIAGMLTLLFGFTLPTRYINAKSDKEKKEILVRDILSFGAILFAAKALSRGFSGLFAKMSGMALNTKPADHSKGILNKLKNYFTAGEGINVLTSEQIITKYSNIAGYKDGINGFFKFLEENGGDVKKVLKMDDTVRKNAESIIKKFANGTTLDEASLEQIHEAFAKAKNTETLDKIYQVFNAKDNKFVTRAKTMNSAFNFASIIVLVPAFMIWLARYCEKMTKKAIEKEMAQQQNNNQENQPKMNIYSNIEPNNKPTMAGFLNK